MMGRTLAIPIYKALLCFVIAMYTSRAREQLPLSEGVMPAVVAQHLWDWEWEVSHET